MTETRVVEASEEKLSQEDNELKLHLQKWVEERSVFTKRSERVVRQRIANAITTDILHPNPGDSTDVDKYRVWVGNALDYAFKKIRGLRAPGSQEGTIIIKESPISSFPGQSLTTRVRYEGDKWISEEIANNKVISQASIEGDNKLITLNYESYEKEGANPKIVDSDKFPTGASVIFLNHLASLRIIDWKIK